MKHRVYCRVESLNTLERLGKSIDEFNSFNFRYIMEFVEV